MGMTAEQLIEAYAGILLLALGLTAVGLGVSNADSSYTGLSFISLCMAAVGVRISLEGLFHFSDGWID
jgi:hypothetical protein